MSRRVRAGLRLLAALLGLSVLPGLVFPASTASAAPRSKAGEVILKFRPGASQAEKDAILGELHANRLKHFSRIGAEHERITGMSVEQAIRRFRGNPAVQYIEPNYIVEVSRTPNDPSFGLLWGMRNTAQFGGMVGADIHAVNAWDTTTGSSEVIVGVIDTGIDYNHPDLAANIYVNPGEVAGNGLDDDGNGFVDDVHGWDFVNHDNDPFDDYFHGTHCAGTIGAVGNNGIGVAGVCWQVRLMPIKFLSASGGGTNADAISAIEYGVLMHCKILSNSWGGGGFSEGMRDAIQDANNAGILFVAAAGNFSSDTDAFPFYPADYEVPNVISVAATTPADDKADFSNYGLTTVDLGAPGTQTLSTVPSGGYGYASGTSMATPHVAGALALMLSRFPLLTAPAAKELLLNSVDHLSSLNGLVATGGRLNVERALQGRDTIPPGPVADLTGTGIASNRVSLAWTASGDDGGVGTAASYEIRYATTPISEGTFNAATLFAGSPAPQPVGSHQTAVVGGLNASTTYFFAMKVRDEYGNPSPISNLTSALTLVPPEIDVSPTALSASLVSGGTDLRTITLRNLTVGTLDFEILAAPTGSGGGAAVSAPATLVPFSWQDYAQAAAGDSAATSPETGVTAALDLTPVISDPAGDGGLVDVTGVSAAASHDSVTIELDFSTVVDRLNFGGFLSLDTDQNPATGITPSFGNGSQDIGAEFQIQLFSLGSGTVSLYHAPTRTFIASLPAVVGPHFVRFRIPLAALGEDDGSMNLAGVVGDDIGPTDWFPDAGHGTIAGIRWLAATPSSGTVPPGGTLTLQVLFDANGLPSGSFDGALRILSNDPDEPVTIVTGHLAVTGTPRISLSATGLDFGPVLLGSSRTDSMDVSNVGSGPLHITEVSSDAAAFVTATPPFLLQPGERRAIRVTFTPGSLGAFEGSLFVFSDDDADPGLFVAMTGSGVMAPDISVSPPSLSASLPSGHTDTRTLAIGNTGLSGLSVTIETQGAVTSSFVAMPPSYADGPGSVASTDATPAVAQAGAVAPASVLVIQDTSASGLFMSSFLQNQFGITPTVISSFSIGATDFTRFDLVITVGDEFSAYYEAISLNQTKFEDYVRAGGVVQYQLATLGNEVRLVGGVRARFGNLELQNQALLPGHPIVAGLPWILEGNYANHNYFINLPAGAARITETSVSHLPTTVEYAYGSGKVIATGMTWEFLYQFGFPAGPILHHGTAYSLSQVRPRWLHAAPATANVPTGGSQNVVVTFDTNALPAGGYDAALRLTSNDPDEALLLVPAHLDVIPSPDIALSSESLSLGSVFVGGSRTDSIQVSNLGTDPLTVSEVIPSPGVFTATPASFQVNPGQRRGVLVTFRPTSVGAVSGTLRFRSNDLDEPEVSVALVGTGIEPPVVALSPDSFQESLLAGETASRILHVINQGQSPLEFSVDARRVLAGGASVPDTITAPAGPPPSGPTPNETHPSAVPIEVAAIYSGTHLRFGITSLGEVMPYAYPIGNEHLQIGAFVSGYSLAYMEGGVDHVAVAGNEYRTGLIPVSFQELENNLSQLVVSVVTRTTDSRVEVEREFRFDRSSKSLAVRTELRNIGGTPITNVVFKEFTDWDVDQTPGGDIWNYDRARNLIYASQSRFLALGASEPPTVMDLYGWNDYWARGTIVDYPTGPVPVDGLAVLHFDRGTLSPAQATEISFAYGAGDNLAELQRVMEQAFSPDWITLSPRSGIVPPGSSVDVTVGLDATHLVGGDYRADILTRSNDPVRPEVATPVSLHVTGIPQISVSPMGLDFGIVYVGLTASRSVTVRNPGTDVLSVTGTLDDPHYAATPLTFTVDPGDSQIVSVVFAPTAVADVPATLVLSHNAPGPPVTLALLGRGLYPPDIDVTPTSLSAALFTGQSQTQSLSVRNTGASDLVVSIATAPIAEPSANPSPRPRDGSGSAGAGTGTAVTPVTTGTAPIVVIQDNDSWGLNLASFLEDRFGLSPTVIHASQVAGADFSPFRMILTAGGQSPEYYNTISSNRAKFESFLAAGGVIQYQLANEGTDVNLAGGAQMRIGSPEYQNRVLQPAHPIVSGLPLLLEGDYVSLGFLVGIPSGGQIITETAISHVSTTVEYPFAAGHVIATSMTWEYLYLYGWEAGAMLPKATVHSRDLSTPHWLTAAPSSATIPPGGALDVGVTFNAAGLNGGDYAAPLQIRSNDPDEGTWLVATHLTVTGAPEITVSPAAIAFGSIFVGVSRTDSITISNTGTDRLDVTEISTTHPSFTQDASPFSLVPGQSRVLHVTFRPTSTGTIAATLRLRSNDSDEAEVLVNLSGVGLPPPVIAVSPTSLHADVPRNQSVTRTLQLQNTGGSALDFQAISFVTASSVEARESMSLGKGEVDPRIGAPVIQKSGGPDHFGYIWKDSDQPGGPPFGWVEIGTIGTPVPISGDDATSPPTPLPFSFHFYGNTFTSFRVCTNGFLSFTSTSAAYGNQPLPTSGAPENMIAAFWDDLYVPPGTVLTHGDADRMVVEFKNVFLLSGAGPYTFEIVLFPNGTFVMQYLAIDGPTGQETVGFQNGTRDDGLTIAFNTPYLHEGLAIRCSAIPSWLTVTPETGSVIPGGSMPLTANLSASGVEPGDYAAAIELRSNDPANPSLDVPVTLRVLGLVEATATQVDPNTLNRLSNGRFIQAYVELPAGIDPHQVVLSTVRFQATIPTTQSALVIGDFNTNGIPDLQFQFDRNAVEQILAEGNVVPVVVTGDIQSTASFVARDDIRVIRPRLGAPNGGELLAPGSTFTITWQNPQGWSVDRYDLYYTVDAGTSWNVLAEGVTGTSYAWTVPQAGTNAARVRVYAYDASGIMGYDTSDQPFTIGQVTAVEETGVPRIHALFQNEPNPFNPSTVIRFDLPEATRVRIVIYGVDGRRVRTAIDGPLPAGRHRVTWDGKNDQGLDVGTGVYYYRMDAGAFQASRKLILLK